MSLSKLNRRLESYKKVSDYLNDKGAPSYMFSHLEKLLEPNGIFLKQREEIFELKSENKRLWAIFAQIEKSLESICDVKETNKQF